MKNCILILAVLFISPIAVLATEPSDSYVQVEINLENDNPFLNLFPDFMYVDNDYGYTHGLDANVEIVPEYELFEKGERWTLDLGTKLFTRDITPDGQDLFPNDPQLFNEVTRLDLTWDNILAAQELGKTYYILGVGIGRVNDMDDSGWGGVGQQRRWHDYKHNNLTPESTSMYASQFGSTNETFLTVQGAIGKSIKFNSAQKDCNCELDRIKLEAGAEILMIKNGSKVYALIGIDKTVARFGENQSIGVIFNNTVDVYSSDAVELKTFAGVRYGGKNWLVKTGLESSVGNKNQLFLKYDDDDDAIWSLTLQKRFQ